MMTNQSAFTASRHVSAFTEWLATHHAGLSIDLDIKSSRYVPGGIRAGITGLDALPEQYRWVSEGSGKGDWNDTRQRLRELGNALRQALAAADEEAALAACAAILHWGGDRNRRVGAWPILSRLGEERGLVRYLETARLAFTLDRAVIGEGVVQAARMNSMLTKVHALASSDGLPIYDSRVAAAIAALVELWRRTCGLEATPLPPELAFAPTTSERSVLYLFDDAQAAAPMSYAPADAAETAARWSSAKIRLGWLLRATLDKAPGLFAGQPERDRMHAFEACLFMIGYDVACLRENWPGTGIDKKKRVGIQRAARQRLAREQGTLAHRTIGTLTSDEGNIAYAGNADTGISGKWNDTAFAFDADFLQALLADFPPTSEAGLGASMTGNVAPGTLGAWMNAHYPAKSRRLASALAPILVDQGLARRIDDASPVRLLFL